MYLGVLVLEGFLRACSVVTISWGVFIEVAAGNTSSLEFLWVAWSGFLRGCSVVTIS